MGEGLFFKAGDLLNSKQLAEYLGIAERTLFQWRRKGISPPAYKLNRRLRWKWEDVQGWLESNRAVVGA